MCKYDIERKARHSLPLFTFQHHEWYTDLARYQPRKHDFYHLVQELLADGWIADNATGMWSMVRPPFDRTPESGFKIHISSTTDSAVALLSSIVPILVAEGTAFKFLADQRMLGVSNSNRNHKASCGKFITIYPVDIESFMRLMNRLHEATQGFVGPYILSDKRYAQSKVLFYRYGAFKRQRRVNLYGEFDSLMRTPDGRIIRDVRAPHFSLPEGITDPYPTTEPAVAEPILKNRYKPTRLMSSSSKGGVYECVDILTGDVVVVKEARPLVNRNQNNPYDAVDCLKNEYEILQNLENTGLVPKPLDFFDEWEHSFMVTEFIKGKTLAAYRSSEEFSILNAGELDSCELRLRCAAIIRLAKQLIAGIRRIHARGVVIQDLSPQNIMIDVARGAPIFIDLEAAYADRNGVPGPNVSLYTLGFGVEPRRGEKPTKAGDYLALSRILGDLIYPITPFFSLVPERQEHVLDHFAKESGIPNAFIRLVIGVGNEPANSDALLAEAECSIEGITIPESLPPQRSDDELREILDKVKDYILDLIHCGSDPLELPTDYRRFNSNKLSVAYGAAGIAYFLARVTPNIPNVLLSTLEGEALKIDSENYSPGLYIGSSGVAWALLELGRSRDAEALMKVASRSPLLHENGDMFYGAAGFGLANLFFFDRLGDEEYLQQANNAFNIIKAKLKVARRGYCYVNAGDDIHHGVAHGAAGIGYFLLQLYQVTGKEEHLQYAAGLLDFELSCAEVRRGHVVYRRCAKEPVFWPYWRSGSAGIGSVALRFYAALRDSRYLLEAQKIAESLEGKYSVSPTNLCGMAGIGNFFVDMHRATGDDTYMQEARKFLDRIMQFAIERPSGIAFPGEELVRICTDYGTGSAGTGVFIHRILTGAGIPFFDY